MKKMFIPFALVLVILVLAGISFLADGGQERGMTPAARATATFGAEQFYVQLTAIASQSAQP